MALSGCAVHGHRGQKTRFRHIGFFGAPACLVGQRLSHLQFGDQVVLFRLIGEELEIGLMQAACDVDEEDQRSGEDRGEAEIENVPAGCRYIGERNHRRQEAEEHGLAQEHAGHGRDREREEKNGALVEDEGSRIAGFAVLQGENGPGHAHGNLRQQQNAAPLALVLDRDLVFRRPADQHDADRMHGEGEESPDEELRLRREIGPRRGDQERDHRDDRSPLQRGGDMHRQHFDIEGRRGPLGRLQSLAGRSDGAGRGPVA